MNTDKRKAKIIYNIPGGFATKNAITNRVTIPVPWVKAMGITKEDRDVLLEFDRDTNKIIITKLSEADNIEE